MDAAMRRFQRPARAAQSAPAIGRRVWQWWRVDELPLASYYSHIVTTSVLGEVLHCKGHLNQIAGGDAAKQNRWLAKS